MKTLKVLTLLTLFIGFSSCNSDDDNSLGNDTITFEGSFSRNFEVENITQRATYTIAQDKITYALEGGFAETNYDITKEYYAASDNRWIGYRASNETYYVIFFKNTSDSEITLYKKEVESVNAGMTEPIPASDDAENYGWNTYYANLAVSGTVENLYAPQSRDYTTGEVTGDYVKFSFESGGIVTGDDWDIAFRGTTIIVNGGSATASDQPERNGNAAAYIASGIFDDINTVDTALFVQDDSDNGLAITTGSGNGWYNYNSTNHTITPIAGKVLIFRTSDNLYAKVEITSFYENGEPNETVSNSYYYTFNYEYQANEGITTF